MKIVGFESYVVTPQGEVINTRTGRVLKQDDNRTGYKRVTLSEGGKLKRFFVHRLVAIHYIPNPYNLKEVNHINGDKSDNGLENLEWCSSSGNKRHAIQVGLTKSKVGRTYHSSEVVHKVCTMLESGKHTYQAIADECGVSYNSVCLIRTKRSWKSISDGYNI